MNRLLKNLFVEFQLVAEVVVDQREIRWRAQTNLANGCASETLLRKNLGGGLEQTVARVIGFWCLDPRERRVHLALPPAVQQHINSVFHRARKSNIARVHKKDLIDVVDRV